MAHEGVTTLPESSNSGELQNSAMKLEPDGNLSSVSPLVPMEEANVAPTTSDLVSDPPGDETLEDPTQERNSDDILKKHAVEAPKDATAIPIESEAVSAVDETIKLTTTPSGIVVSSSKKSRPPFTFDPDTITLRFLFANRDGLTVTVVCKPTDTVGEVKGALISVWPDDMPDCDGGDSLRLVCMGKGYLSPDTRTLEDCQIPVFRTHPTPVNVSVKPSEKTRVGDGVGEVKKKGIISGSHAAAGVSTGNRSGTAVSTGATVEANQGCCIIL